MSKKDAGQLLAAWQSGYIENPEHPELVEAGQLLGRRAYLQEIPSPSNPKQKLFVRGVSRVL